MHRLSVKASESWSMGGGKQCKTWYPTWLSLCDSVDNEVPREYSIGSYRRAKILKQGNDSTRKVVK